MKELVSVLQTIAVCLCCMDIILTALVATISLKGWKS